MLVTQHAHEWYPDPMKTRLFAAVAASILMVSNAAPAAGALKTAIFAGGCFWSAEHDIEHTPGVKEVVVGYAGGSLKNPTYENHEGHLESIRVTYDPAVISYPQLVTAFFHHIDPTEKTQAEQVKAQVGKELGAYVRTMVLGPTTFWMGEGYHQHYADKNPVNYMTYRVGCGRDRTLKVVWGGHGAQGGR